MSETDPQAAADPASQLLSRAYLVLLAIASLVGVIVSLAAWCFLELVYQVQREVFHHLPSALGYSHGAPLWWSLPVLATAGLIVAFAIVRLPGSGGHIPAEGLKAGGGPAAPNTLPGVALAGLAAIGLGTVVGPEAPLADPSHPRRAGPPANRGNEGCLRARPGACARAQGASPP